jgi:hypothetical protein
MKHVGPRFVAGFIAAMVHMLTFQDAEACFRQTFAQNQLASV